MSTTAVPAPTQLQAGRGTADRSAEPLRASAGAFGPPAEAGARPPSGFHAALVLAVLLTVPAVYLVGRGELSAHDALVRFGCAWGFATGGVALLLSTVGTRSEPDATASASTAQNHVGDVAVEDLESEGPQTG